MPTEVIPIPQPSHTEKFIEREIHEGLNVVENWNSANDFILYGRGGEIATNRVEDHEITVLALHLLQVSLVYINTLMIQRVLSESAWADRMTAENKRGLTPLVWGHVNNAAYGLFGAAEEVSDDQIRHQIDTNLIGSIQVIRAVLPHLRAQGGGRVLQVSSEGGQIAYPNFSLYHATKWGIEGFVEAVAQEVAPFDIEFTIAEPGPAKTSFGSGMVSPPPMDVYKNTPAGEMRRAFASGTFNVKGDPIKMAQAMIDSVDRSPAPKRKGAGKKARKLL